MKPHEWPQLLLLIPLDALLLFRLGGAHRQPRQDLLRGSCKQNHDVAAANSSPGPTGAAEVQLHPANGAAEPEVRTGVSAVTVLFCGWANFYTAQSRKHSCLSFISVCPVIKV